MFQFIREILKKIAKTIAKVLNAKLIEPNKVNINELSKYDLVGFESGIYFQKHHRALLNLVDKLPQLQNKAFIFSTRGIGPVWFYHRILKKKLLKKGFDVVDEFSCRGFDTVGPFKLIGGMNKDRPNKKDLEDARDFARSLKNKLRNG